MPQTWHFMILRLEIVSRHLVVPALAPIRSQVAVSSTQQDALSVLPPYDEGNSCQIYKDHEIKAWEHKELPLSLWAVPGIIIEVESVNHLTVKEIEPCQPIGAHAGKLALARNSLLDFHPKILVGGEQGESSQRRI